MYTKGNRCDKEEKGDEGGAVTHSPVVPRVTVGRRRREEEMCGVIQ